MVSRQSYWDRLIHMFSDKDRYTAVVVDSPEYRLDATRISKAAMMVLDTLRGAGYAAYLVGGGVRDLLLDMRPKDFDVVTDAHPEQVKKIFKHSRIIGRRFRLVHIRYKGELIEVSTFRAEQQSIDKSDDESAPRHENEYGSLEEDAWRRDFPINALYYDHIEGHILDFTGGVLDLKRRMISVIGDPSQRFHEDPYSFSWRGADSSSDLSIDCCSALKVDTSINSPLYRMCTKRKRRPIMRLCLNIFLTCSGCASVTTSKSFGRISNNRSRTPPPTK